MWRGKKVNDKSDSVAARSFVVYKIIVVAGERRVKLVNHAFNCSLSTRSVNREERFASEERFFVFSTKSRRWTMVNAQVFGIAGESFCAPQNEPITS